MRTILLSLVLSIGAPLTAQEAGPARADAFVHLTSRYWHSLDPANAYDGVSFILTGNIYEPLVTFKSLGELDSFAPFLASVVPSRENGLLSEDLKTYSFPIREGVRFHDGSAMSPEDVRYSLLRFMLMDMEGGAAALLLRPMLGLYGVRDAKGLVPPELARRAFQAVEIQEGRVVIHLNEPDSTFLKVLASMPLVVSKKWAVERGDWDGTVEGLKNWPAGRKSFLEENANGTGPFKVDKFERDIHALVLARHDGYWRAPAALKTVIFKVVPNGGLRLFMLESGDADGGYLENTYRGYAKSIKGLKLYETWPYYHTGDIFFFNFKAEPKDNEFLGSGALDGKGLPPDFFGSREVRQGLAYAFDYEKYLKYGLGLQGRRMAGPFPPDMLAGVPESSYRYDPEKAKALLEKACGGEVWRNGFVLPVGYSADNAPRQAAAEALKAGLEKLNPKFKVHLHPMRNKEFYQGVENRKLPLYIASFYPDYPDPQSLAFGLLHSRGYFPKYQGWASAEADALVEKASRLSDPIGRMAIYRKLSELAAESAAQIYTFSPPLFRVCREDVAGCDGKDNVNNLNFNSFPYFYSYSRTTSR